MSDLLLSARTDIEAIHANDVIRPLIQPLPGTESSLEVWKFGEYGRKKTIYGFDLQNRVTVVLELHERSPEIAGILARCRNTQAWRWLIDGKWLPVGTYPAATENYDPPQTSDTFQNGDGNQTIPNAWAKTKSNGNRVAVWDLSWLGQVDNIRVLLAPGAVSEESILSRLESRLETMTLENE
ncbi:hypothetical protein [Roseibacillus persicicus]|uniref:hypothetical protein n=1 Tax=Roseibacillus persicicus TaxID=454148 RepID=UPI00280F80C9|nr:hypothetical protein [Roseibacillus persicicus]MDQ8192443.1 hypothetical protein [Roseibacillus persicicus]